jgi:glyoxylase-like metal-dependent hydrolase (beta-lactamase superfamily II)
MDIDPNKIEIKATPVAGSVTMLEGAGGNIGVSVGDDGVFVIDDEYAPLAPKIKAALAKLSPKPLRFVFNTHWHGDHTGSNEAMAGAGAICEASGASRGASEAASPPRTPVTIVAHDNVRKRMTVEQVMEAFGGMHVPPSPPKALPLVTFNDEVTFHLNGDEIHVFHVPAAHTDGDAVVHFLKANVVHMGDTFINNGYPVIDFSTGGTIDGYIAAQEKVLAIIGPDTKLIPGHGPIGDKAALQKTHDMIKGVRDAVAKASAGGKTLEQVQAAKPTAAFDAEWAKGFIKPDMIVAMVYKTLPKGKSATKKH